MVACFKKPRGGYQRRHEIMSEERVLFQDQATNRDEERRKRMTVKMSIAADHEYVRLSLNHHVHEDGSRDRPGTPGYHEDEVARM
jgi:hypothetical protein